MHKKLDFLRFFKKPAHRRKYFRRYFNATRKDFETIEDIYVPLKLIEKEREIDPGGALKNHRRLVILGVPGAGKTMLLKRLALDYCKENIANRETGFFPIDVPVFIKLREFSGSGKGLRNYIDVVFEKYGFPNARKAVEKILAAGKCILLLDGLDELVTGESKEEALKEINAFTGTYHECKIAVTARTAAYHDQLPTKEGKLPGSFTRLEVMEFDDNQVKEFIDKWFAVPGRGKAEAVLKMSMHNKDIEALARNPLMLSIIAALYDEDNEHPPKRTVLYKRIMAVMLGEWDKHKNVAGRFSPGKKELILRKLAYRNHCRGRRTLTEKEILEEIAVHSPGTGLKKEEYRLFFEEIWRRSYILKPLSIDTYDFLHLSFQEYFAALELSRQENGLAAMTPHISQSWWEGAILFYAGLGKNAAPLINAIRKEGAADIFYTNLMLSGKCIAEAAFTEPLLKEEIVRRLWQLYTGSEFQLLKEKALAVLSRVKPRRIIDELVNQLTDKEPHIRQSAADALGLLGSTEGLLPLVMILVKEKESKIRSHAAIALGQIGSVEAVVPLIHALNTDKEAGVRKSAAEALGFIACSEALPALIKALTSDKSSVVRGGAAEALGKITGAGVVPQLIRALNTEKENSVRWRIAKSLGKPGDADARDVLIKVLNSDKDSEVREGATEALGLIGSRECQPALIKSLTLDKNGDVRGSAAYALGCMRSNEALPVLIKALISDTNGEVRGRAAFALGRIKNIEAIPYLTAVFSGHKESFIRGNAAYALGEIGDAEAIPFLLQALIHDKTPYVRYRAAEVLGNIGGHMTIQPLKTALQDEGSYYGWKVKDKAFEALDKISKRLQVRIS